MIAVALPDAAGFEAWRDAARRLLASRTPPEAVLWSEGVAADLFGASPGEARTEARAPRTFIELARKAVLHRDRERFALLYRLLWRLQDARDLMEDAADPDVARLQAMAKAVRRDEHKMHAFVRFKETADAEGSRFVAWFEPEHHILEETADFFVRRFAGMRWSIITPEASAHWDGEQLRFGPGGSRSDAPAEDARDADWRAYYQSMFNPARLKVGAMTKEMPKRYWKNLPEAQDIPDLIAAACGRADVMVAAAPTAPRKRAGVAHARIAPARPSAQVEAIAERREPPHDVPALAAALSACRACPLWKGATQAVPGQGPTDAPLLALVGEQPGDQEDLAGLPFVGPAGQVLDRALADAGVDRHMAYVTNAVKHFKHEPRGKRRLHKRPDTGEVEACRWWLGHELRLIRPRLTVALGATALAALSGKAGALNAARGRTLQTLEGLPLRATYHPSYLLRLPDEDAKAHAFAAFVADLREAQALARTL